MADPNQPPRRSLVTFNQKLSGSGSFTAGNPQAQTMRPETSGGLSQPHGSNAARSLQPRQPLFGLNTAHHRQQQQQHALGNSEFNRGRDHQSNLSSQHEASPTFHHSVFSSDSSRDAVMPLIGSSAVVSAPSSASTTVSRSTEGFKRSAAHLSTADGNNGSSMPSAKHPLHETVDSSSSSAVSDAANAVGSTATRARSGRQVKRPKFADEVVHTEPSFARLSGLAGTSGGVADKRSATLLQHLEQRGMGKQRKSSGATSHTKKSRQHELGGVGSPMATPTFDEFGNVISPVSPATSSSTPSLPSNSAAGNLSDFPRAEDTRLPINVPSKPRVFSAGSVSQFPSTSTMARDAYNIGTGGAPPKVSSTVHQTVPIRSSESRAAALSSPLPPDDDVFSPPPPLRHSSSRHDDALRMFGGSLPMRRGSGEPQQFVVLKPPENNALNSGGNRGGSTSFDYESFRQPSGSGIQHSDDQQPSHDGGETADNSLQKAKRKYTRKQRRTDLELDEALTSNTGLNSSHDVSFTHSTNDVDAGTEASGSVLTGTGGGKKRGGNQPRRSSKTPSGRHNTPGSAAGTSSKKKAATKAAKPDDATAVVAGATNFYSSRKLSKQQIASALPCMKELVLLKQQRDELLKLISTSKNDLRPTTLKKIQKLITKLGELADYTVGAWKPIDDLRLIHGVEQLNDLEAVRKIIKFSCHFSSVDIEERWNALLHDENIAKLSFQAIQELPVTQLLLVQRERYMTPIEMEMLKRIVPSDKPYTVEFFDRVLAENKEVFLACRTGHDLMREWQTLQKFDLLPPSNDDTGAHIPAPGAVPIYHLERQATNDALAQLGGGGSSSSAAAAEPVDADTIETPSKSHAGSSTIGGNALFLQNKGAVHDMMERATLRMHHRIRTLEFELPRLKVLLEYMTGVQTSSFDPDFPEMCLAVLRGKMARFLILRPEVNFGRSCPGFEPDINLSYEGPATRISRHHGRIVLDISGRFAITNEGSRPFLVDDMAVLRGEYCFLNDYSIVEICGLTLVFYITTAEVAKQLKKRVKKDHDDVVSSVMTAHGSDAIQNGIKQHASDKANGSTSAGLKGSLFTDSAANGKTPTVYNAAPPPPQLPFEEPTSESQ